MLYQQLRILVFMAIALIRLSTAADWECNDTQGYVACTVTLNSGNTIRLGEPDGQKCTHDGKYCAEVKGWTFSVTNNGETCVGGCQPHQVCDTTGLRCWNECDNSAC